MATKKKSAPKKKKAVKNIYVLYDDWGSLQGEKFTGMKAAEDWITKQALDNGCLDDYIIAEKVGTIKVQLHVNTIKKTVATTKKDKKSKK